MVVKVHKLHKDAVIPNYAKINDAGLDLTAATRTPCIGFTEYGTGLAFEIPAGYVGLVFPRSSISNTRFVLSNSVGVVDAGYRGEIKLRLKRIGGGIVYNVGDRIGQLLILPYPQITLVEVDSLSPTSRGDKGFGSSGA